MDKVISHAITVIPSVEGIKTTEGRPMMLPTISEEVISMNGRVAATMVEIATIPERPQVETGTVALAKSAKTAQFERCRWPYVATMPISWILVLWVMAKKTVYRWFGKSNPHINTLWFDGLGLSNRAIKDAAASWRSLDIIYNHRFGQTHGLRGMVDDFWIGMINAQAVRNRLILVKQEIRRAILRFSNHQEVRLLSLAAGSAQGVIEVMAELKANGIRVRALLLDVDQTALDYAQVLAKRHGVGDQIEVVKASVAQVARVSRDFRPQIIEMLGLLDYIPQDKAIRLVGKIRESLETKGIFLTCNICHNPERYFLQWVINWSMIYRTPAEMAEVVTAAGFGDYRLIYEPLKVHGLVITQKD